MAFLLAKACDYRWKSERIGKKRSAVTCCFLLDVSPRAWVSSEQIQIQWGAHNKTSKISKSLLEARKSSYTRSSFPWGQSWLAAKGHCHMSVSALRFFWNISVVQTTTWKHIKPRENGLKIQISLHVISLLRKTNSLIPLQARPELWRKLLAMLCGLWKVSRTADAICNSCVPATSQAAPAGFSGLSSSFAVTVTFSKMLKSFKRWYHHCETWSLFLHVQKTGQDNVGWAKIHLRLVETIEPVQITMNAIRHTWGMHGMTSLGEGKAGHCTHSRSGLHQSAVVCVTGLQYLNFLRDSGFCLSCAWPETYDPLRRGFFLYIRQALKKRMLGYELIFIL